MKGERDDDWYLSSPLTAAGNSERACDGVGDDTSVFVQTGAGITVSRKLPWDGMRAFAVLSEGSSVRLRSDNGLQEFLFTPEVLTYSENGKLQRVWRRIAERK